MSRKLALKINASGELLKRALHFLGAQETLRVALLYAGILSVVYASVIFFGYTLQPASYASYGITETGANGYEGRRPIYDFNIDMASSAYYEPGIHKTIGDMYKDGELPLWNPYQASGTPLSAQFSTRAFFPYQILEDISPTWSWDFFMLGRLWVVAIFTYLFLKALKLKPASAFLGGLFYMLSGAMVWFIHKEEFVNVAMTAPILLWAIEKLLSAPRSFYFIIVMLASALVMLSGNPEVAAYILLLGGAYALYRILSTHGIGWSSIRTGGTLAVAVGLGFGLSAPLLLPFRELSGLAFHMHPSGGTMGVVDPAPTSWGIGIVLPTFFDTPSPQRWFPINGVWEFLGGYTGILPLFLAFTGVLGKSRHRGLLIFFLIFGIWIILKNLGVSPFNWIGRLPLLDQVWSNRWAGPAWNFSLAIAGALGFEALAQRWGSITSKQQPWRQSWHILVGACLLAGMLVALLFLDQTWGIYQGMVPDRHYLMVPHSRDYMLAALQGAVIVAISVLVTVLLLWRTSVSAKGLQFAIVALAITELWFYIPRGYNYEFYYLKLIPFALGIIAVWTLARERWKWGVTFIALAALVATGLDVGAPHGFPKRQDPLQAAPYVEYLKEHSGLSRVMATDGVLMPNSAGALGLYDVRYINSVTVATYHNYMLHLRDLNPAPWGPRPPDSSDLWFSGLSPVSFAPGMELPLPPVIEEQLPYYSTLGVRYIITPSTISMNGFPLVYAEEVNIYENTDALPRAFVVHQLEYLPSSDAAQERIGQPSFDWKKTVTIEEEIPSRYQSMSDSDISPATISDYKPNYVAIELDTEDIGMLVLSDTYFPGWLAKVDGNEAKIYRVNGVMRGVFVEPGHHKVEFTYLANSFRQGVGIAVLSLLLGVGFFWIIRRAKIERILQ